MGPPGCAFEAICLMRHVEIGTAQCEGSSSSLRSGEKKQEYQVSTVVCNLQKRIKYKGSIVWYFFCEVESTFGVLGFGDTVFA